MNALFRKLFIRHQSEAASADAPAGGDAGGAAGGAEQEAATQPTDGAQGENLPGPEGEQGKSAAEGEDKPDGDKKPGEQKPEGAPEKYEFAAPEGTEIDAEALAQFEPIARELNLNQKQAQKLVDLYGKQVMPKIIAQQAENWQKQTAEWAVSAKGDKEIGGDKFDANMTRAKQAMDKFATPALREFLESTGMGNHPELIRTFVKVGAAMSEDVMHTGSSQVSGGDDLVSAFYPGKK